MPLVFAHSQSELQDLAESSSDKSLGDGAAGAHVTFSGTVRKLNQGREVSYLFYEAYQALASSQFLELEQEARAKFKLISVTAVHLLGPAAVGSTAVIVKTSAQHRAEAFQAARWLMDELKAKLAIWKCEYYTDGTHTWEQALCACAAPAKPAVQSLKHPGLISFEEALRLIDSQNLKLKHKQVSVEQALGSFLGENIYAPIDLPVFDNSAVDGYALRFADLNLAQAIPVAGEIRAVGQALKELKPGTCQAIMTGAPIPTGADTVLMKENIELSYPNMGPNNQKKAQAYLSSLRQPRLGENIRAQGEDLTLGSLLAPAGARLSSQLIGALCGVGLSQVEIFAPKIQIICTGDELVSPGQELEHGQVYFLVGAMLKAQCQDLAINDVLISRVGDNQADIERAIAGTQTKIGLEPDILLITGGMSKGDYDLVPKALKNCGAEQIFYQGAWRPGKPLYFGRLKQTYIFGLPGNPVACFVAFRVFVRALLAQAMNNPELIAKKSAVISHDFSSPTKFTNFARGIVNSHKELSLLSSQGSHEIANLSRANALCELEAARDIIKAGERVSYYNI